ncbi:MAG TPA: DUF5989 family protein [Candidatus Sumerlaeota bacterium]|jgi:heme/copper-type cytochrome/quinol oxidase subunit 2|nr:MAG: hypothetical protein BWY12_01407 [candidate division BRC1 bacterium ADurb.Bin183]HOE64734.1 DUF5989 family protein [Candidatus Sumerlaeota bacterium]HRR30046.1 DUF5989 family protein [Candidatus Sumerlaeia bacterium]HON51244.1 DUF5989 family protein [Candidatus Sumerlaeota bacterium]HOR64439.1 DUF5989 family protein [Candidatus Sumerlaeota bacterium]
MAKFFILAIFLAAVGFAIYALYRYRERVEILKEFFEFLKERKLWWIMPIAIVLLLLGVLIVAIETGAISTMMYVLF